MTLEELQEELAAGQIRSAYLLSGEEALLREDALRDIREAVLGDAPADFNFDRLDGQNATAAQLTDSVQTLPVMAPRRLVVLRDPEAARGRDKGLLDAVAALAKRPASDADVVLVVTAPKSDRRAAYVKAFKDPAAEVRCDPPRNAREATAFVRAEAERQGVSFEAAAGKLLVERVGGQLLLLRQEIAKAALLAGPGKKVKRQHVESGTADAAEEPIWDLTDAIGEGRAGDALSVLAKLTRVGAPAPVLLGALASHFRRLLRVKAGGEAAGPPFVRRKLQSQAQRYTGPRLRSCLDAIHTTDTALKGAGALSPELALERLVLGLAG